MKKTNKLTTLIILIISVSCTNVPKEIKKTTLYKEVMRHYDKEDENIEKKEAALFLFRDMAVKYSRYDEEADKVLTTLYDSIKKADTFPETESLVNLLKQKAPKTSNVKLIKDYSTITSKDLIEHIDITYKNWKKLSVISKGSFNDYCEYILPYRVREEPLAEFCTKAFEAELMSLADTLQHGDSIIPAISTLIKSIDCKTEKSLSNSYPEIISPKHLSLLKIAPRCEDCVIFVVLALRSMGIPATYDYVPQWGNHHFLGHSWLAVKWQQKWYAFDAADGKYLNLIYEGESIPKVYRKQYATLKGDDTKDVTDEYRNVVDLRIDIKNKWGLKSSTPAVAVFNKYQNFKVVDFGKKDGSHFVFKTLGQRVIYFIGTTENGKFIPLAHPIYVDSCGSTKRLIPDWGNLKTYNLHRKFPLTTGRYRKKEIWAKSLSGSWIEASKNNFKISDTLLVFNNFNSFKEEYFVVNSDKTYSEIRYRCGPKDQIASIKFFDQKNNLLKGQIAHDLWKGFEHEKLFDNDMLTYVTLGNSRSYVFVYRFNKTQHISGIAIHARNDGNHIVVGDEYELMVFDENDWKSLGVKIADKQELEFSNVPAGGLYWLKNLSQGKEELPFMFDSEGNQFWAGQ